MPINKTFLTFCLSLVMLNSFSQNEIIPLWNGDIPNSQKSNDKEIVLSTDATRISLVQTPTLEVFLPTKKSATGKAVIICPGGGYKYVVYDWEGTDIAKWYNSKGIAAFVLKYRLPNSKSVKVSYEAPLQDAQRALRIVRSQAEKWQVNPNKIGIMGFSAGGHVASTLGIQFDKPNIFKETTIDAISARPDFMILIYPVVTMKTDYTHKGSRLSLLGENPTDVLINQYSNELQVTENTPPTFIVHATDDAAVPVENSLNLYKALKDKGVKTEMHIYPEGGHGFSLAIGSGYLQTWPDRLFDWLQSF
ncbi:acetyl esterase/lipase [Mariniflexile fucanivorans]|uniref:Acetyl esterase/lipase n=1 Tax=Mariniflexile fucanivorans TaxID=264023 RepID=A0A4R1RHD6_9FLAO|nr:alpha/beta hydrolase [Mariniflexile fucanivorans]TCL65488.1 acetyl esterase/lipase [Mariniflexile fucanivorans]